MSIEPTAFASDYWSRQPLLSPADGLPRDFTDLLDLDAVDELLSRRGVRTPFLRVAKGGNIRPAASFTRGGGAGADVGDQLADDKILDLFADGNTLVLQGLHRLWPPLIDFAAALRAEIAHPVQVNGYLTPRSSQGFAHHYDVHDVFVLQVAGAKRWQVHPPVLDAPLRSQPWTDRKELVELASAEQPLMDVVLEPGDALYLPRGYVHGAQALAGVSAHVTVGVHSVTRFAIVQALLAQAATEPALRESLPMGIDFADPDGVLAGEVRATIAAVKPWLDKADIGGASEVLRREVWSQTRPAPISPIRTSIALSRLDDQSVIRLRPYLQLYWTADEDRLKVETPTHTLALQANAAPTLRALRTGNSLRVADLPDLEPAAALDLVTALVRSGVVVLV